MKQTLIFNTFKITLHKSQVLELRQKIREIATERKLDLSGGIHYERLLEDFKKKLNDEIAIRYEFILDNKPVEILNPSVMFSVFVLKNLFNWEGEHLTLQAKNLEILSMYAFNLPYEESPIINLIDNNNKKKIFNGSDSEPIKKRKIFKFFNYYLISGIPIILLPIVIFLAVNNFKLTSKIESIRNENEKLNHKIYNFKKHESRYQTILNRILTENNILKGINQNDSNILIDTSTEVIFHKNFTIDTSSEFLQNFEISYFTSNNKFKLQPGYKICDRFGGISFGFGTTYCESDCFVPESFVKRNYNYSTTFRLTFKKEYFIKYLSFKWVEVGKNWGSGGRIFINDDSLYIGDYVDGYIGNWPPSTMLRDETIRTCILKIYRDVKYFDIVVSDIADGSEIFINEIKVYK